MGFTSENNSSVNHSNGNYEVGDIIFPSKFIYKTIKRIDRNLRKLYSPGSEETDWLAENYSPVRDDIEKFNTILDKVDNLLDVLKSIDEKDSSIYFYLRKDQTTENSFLDKFEGILNCINEHWFGERQNNHEDRIIDIAKRFSSVGFPNPYEPAYL